MQCLYNRLYIIPIFNSFAMINDVNNMYKYLVHMYHVYIYIYMLIFSRKYNCVEKHSQLRLACKKIFIKETNHYILFELLSSTKTS